MQTVTTPTPTSPALIAARHIVGMMIAALAYSRIYSDEKPITTWMVAWLGPLIWALVLYALYALFFTKHAKSRWPSRFYVLAWAIFVLIIMEPWLEKLNDSERERERKYLSEPATQSQDEKWWEQSPIAENYAPPQGKLEETSNPDLSVDLFEIAGIKKEPKPLNNKNQAAP